ncbi:MAG: hypothetical protein Q8914_04210 [Bacteroidota bacterium]|nr:hypothetical protein [Bacteroidota bacterium]
METLTNKFKQVYLISLVVLLLLDMLSFWLRMNVTLPSVSKALAITLQQLMVIVVIVGIPGVLFWSSKKIKILKTLVTMKERLAQYRKVVMARLAVYFIIGCVAIVIQLLANLKGGDMFFIVVLVMFVFIWPTNNRLKTETDFGKNPPVPENEEGEISYPED